MVQMCILYAHLIQGPAIFTREFALSPVSDTVSEQSLLSQLAELVVAL